MFPCKKARMTFRLIMLQIIISAALLLQPLELRAADTILPEGTRISLQLNDDLSTKSNSEGDAFTAIVMAPVNLGDKIVIPKGSVVNGSISRMIRPGRFKGKAGMYLLFQSISIPGRGQLPIFATATRINSPGSGDVGIEGRIEGEGSGESAGKIVAPALAGAESAHLPAVERAQPSAQALESGSGWRPCLPRAASILNCAEARLWTSHSTGLWPCHRNNQTSLRITSIPPMYGRSASGITTEPSLC